LIASLHRNFTIDVSCNTLHCFCTSDNFKSGHEIREIQLRLGKQLVNLDSKPSQYFNKFSNFPEEAFITQLWKTSNEKSKAESTELRTEKHSTVPARAFIT
jgi:hypothetical protein